MSFTSVSLSLSQKAFSLQTIWTHPLAESWSAGILSSPLLTLHDALNNEVTIAETNCRKKIQGSYLEVFFSEWPPRCSETLINKNNLIYVEKKNAQVEEFERMNVCGMSSHLLCGIVMCCVMISFFLFHNEPAQLSVRETERGKGRKPTTQLL